MIGSGIAGILGLGPSFAASASSYSEIISDDALLVIAGGSAEIDGSGDDSEEDEPLDMPPGELLSFFPDDLPDFPPDVIEDFPPALLPDFPPAVSDDPSYSPD